MASKNPETQEGGGQSSNVPLQEKEAPPKQRFSNLPAVLLFDHGKEQYHLLRLPAGDRTHAMNNKPILPSEGLHIGSVEGGWLILYNSFSRPSEVVSGYEDQFLCYNYISLLNPLSGWMLDLPPEPCFLTHKDYKTQFAADVITSNCSPDSPEFFVVAFFLNANRHWLAFCGIDDESWTRIADIKHIRDPSVLVRLALALDDKNKLLYFVHLSPSASNYDMMVFDLKDSKNIKMKKLVMAESNTLPREGIFAPAIKGDGRVRVRSYLNMGDRRLYLAADSSCGDLFMVLQENDILEGSTNVLPVRSFRVFIKVDDGDGPEWEEIHELGDRSIFISNVSSRVISTAELNAGLKSEESFRRNCIYFALQNAYQMKTEFRRDIGVFCLADRGIEHFPLPFKFQKVAVATLWWFDSDST